ncbi:Cyb5b [Symbiodinium sp. KB8]|nr:Cyb5b [Symbiodinium sp. KB8]
MAAKQYRLEEVAEHNTESDCWVIVHGKVYDVTAFLDEHPGGPEYLIDSSGDKDATEGFEDYGHSKTARNMLKEYYLGDVHPDDMDKLKATSSGSSGAGKAGADNPNTLVFIGGLLVVLVALYLKFWNVAEEQE